ncbi:hypothetical protein [Alcanivorax sp.]|jgi:hypothetical protein|uniref:hypothetical protein n=1 Tax=Alcanivorax sp. TaxID=1872427 RepID=UPI003BAB4C22
MYKEVSFDPSCMGSMEYYGLVKQHFGYDHGRYISVEVKAWAKEAMRYAQDADLPPVKKQSIKNFLNKAYRSPAKKEYFFLSEDRKGVSEDSWFDWHAEQQRVRPFSFVISESDRIDSITVDDINSDCEEWQVSRSLSVDRNEKDIVAPLVSLMVISSSLTLLDPYFVFADNKVVSELLTNAKALGVSSIRFVTSMQTPGAESIFERCYKENMPNDLSMSWVVVPDKCFHDRYVITEAGAIRSGQGFMPATKRGVHADKANYNSISKVEAAGVISELDELIKSGKAEVVFEV